MAISNIGAIIYTNQNTPVVSNIVGNDQGKQFMAHLVAADTQQDKEKIIQETRPAEELAGVNPDAEHQKDEKDQEEEAAHQEKESPKKKKSETNSPHHLDIKA
jgi:hypothetical protein